ncbi:MAG: DUF1570 domain-containing protein [Planctomycetes bacterium]|nr:DUF1570 domain-containing protein [Planctomycetota bacterium]
MKTLLLVFTLAAAATAGPMFEDQRAGVAFPTPDGWTEVPTPPVPEDAAPSDSPLTPLVRFQSTRPAADGSLARFDVFLVRASTADDAEHAFEKELSSTWRGFEISERRELGSARTFSGKVDGGKAFGTLLQDGKRFAALFLAGSDDATDAPLISATGTWAWSRPDPGAPLRIPPGWKVRETEHYRIRFAGDDDFAAQVGKHLEAISTELRRLLPLEIPGATRRTLDVRIFANTREFQAYAALNGVEGAEAYFSPAQRELVAHMDEKAPERTFHVLYHEATHQYLREVLGKGVSIPIWLDEGLGEIFYPGGFDAGGHFNLRTNEARRDEARSAVNAGRAPELAKMFEMSRDEFYDLAPAYSLGWSVTHFLLNDPRYRGSVTAYLVALRETKNDAKAREKAWTDFTIERLERDWKKWLTEE